MPTSVLFHHHAHLWISDQHTLYQQTIQTLQKSFCFNKACNGYCITCSQIAQKQHANIVWLEPEAGYIMDFIEEIIDQTKFKLNTDEHKIFIFTKAHELTTACSNRLLKTVEEPHTGYIFLFLASRTDTLLPTLTSRCITQEFAHQNFNNSFQEFTTLLTHQKIQPLEFLKLIEKYEIKESETKEILDTLLQYFHTQLITTHKTNPSDYQTLLTITDKIILLKQAFDMLPAPGSSKMFWKNLYLQFHHHQ